jgi:hypothetical protein
MPEEFEPDNDDCKIEGQREVDCPAEPEGPLKYRKEISARMSTGNSSRASARTLGGHADTAKQALEARVGAEAINPWVRFEEPREVQRSLQIGFL